MIIVLDNQRAFPNGSHNCVQNREECVGLTRSLCKLSFSSLDYYQKEGTTEFRALLLRFKTASRIEELSDLTEQIVDLIPQAAVMVGYDQNNHAHQYDLWQHCLHTVLNLPRNLDDDMLYLAALLHDIGKPDCRCSSNREGDTNSHYYGHPLRSMEIVRDDVIPALTARGVVLSPDEQRRLLYYVEYHDDRVSLRQKHLRRHLGLASLAEFQNLMLLQVADAKAHIMLPIIEERIRICQTWAGDYAIEMAKKLNSQ